MDLTRHRHKLYDGIALTASYPVDGLVPTHNINSITYVHLAIHYTNAASGTPNSLQWYIETSNDESTWERVASMTILAGTGTIYLSDNTFTQEAADAGVDKFLFDVAISDVYMRARFKETLNSGVHGGIDVWVGHTIRTQ